MKIKLLQFFFVGAAGALGAMARLGVSQFFSRFGFTFPVATFLINISGSLFLGWFFAFAANRLDISDYLRLAIATGFVGAYTTFSTFMVESDGMLRDGAFWRASIYIIGSLVLGLLAARVGLVLGLNP